MAIILLQPPVQGVPVNTALPEISGDATVGEILTASHGTWTNTPTSYAYQWLNNGSTIGGATSATYILQAGDQGDDIGIRVTATNAVGAGTPAESAEVGPVAASGGGGSSGFTEESGFTVTAASFEHGEAMTITRSSGSWATRTHSTTPWLYDQGDKAWQAGVERTPMAAITDASLVPVTGNTGQPWGAYGSASHRIRLAHSSGSRTPPNARTSRWWYSTTGASDMKTELIYPLWPHGGAQNNQRLYLSWWLRMKNAYAGGGAFQGKYMRFQDTNGAGVGSHQFNPDSINANTTMWDATPGSAGQSNVWMRLEFFADLTNNVLDCYSRYRYYRGSNSSLGGNFEFRSGTAYNAVSNRGGYLYTNNPSNVPFSNSWINLWFGHIGYDGQSGAVHAGQEHDVANAYVDTEWERFEISDSATWSLAPGTTTGTPREIQGRWSRDSNTQCTVYINQGQFASLSGKYLWYVDDFKTATLIGQFD